MECLTLYIHIEYIVKLVFSLWRNFEGELSFILILIFSQDFRVNYANDKDRELNGNVNIDQI